MLRMPVTGGPRDVAMGTSPRTEPEPMEEDWFVRKDREFGFEQKERGAWSWKQVNTSSGDPAAESG